MHIFYRRRRQRFQLLGFRFNRLDGLRNCGNVVRQRRCRFFPLNKSSVNGAGRCWFRRFLGRTTRTVSGFNPAPSFALGRSRSPDGNCRFGGRRSGALLVAFFRRVRAAGGARLSFAASAAEHFAALQPAQNGRNGEESVASSLRRRRSRRLGSEPDVAPRISFALFLASAYSTIERIGRLV